MSDGWLCLIVLWCLSTAVGAIVGNAKNQALLGALLAGLLGPLGWLFILLVPDARRRCPHCAGNLPDQRVTKCMHCGSYVGPNKTPPV